MAFYKACPSSMQGDRGFYSQSFNFMFLSCAMQSAFTQFFLTSYTTLSLELSILKNLVVVGLSILSTVCLLVFFVA